MNYINSMWFTVASLWPNGAALPADQRLLEAVKNGQTHEVEEICDRTFPAQRTSLSESLQGEMPDDLIALIGDLAYAVDTRPALFYAVT